MTAPDPQSIIDALQDWARRTLPAPPSGQGGPECQWCPLCQLASALRGEHPELTDRLAEAGAAVGNAVRMLMAATSGAPTSGSSASGSSASGSPTSGAPTSDATPSGPTPPEKPQPRPRVQRIVLDDETPKD